MPRRRTLRPVTWSSAVVALVLLSAAGCRDDGKVSVYPVQGKVTLNGAPLEGATVQFFTNDESLRVPGVPIPAGTTDAGGVFQLSAYGKADGAPAGDYRVTINQMQVTNDAEDPEQMTSVDRLKGRYSNPDSSGLTATVKEDDNELPAFDLTL